MLERARERAVRSASDHALPMPTDEPSRAGFTNTGGGERDRAALADRHVVHLRDPVRRHQLLEDRLVHRHGGGHHAGAHVRDVEQLEEALHGAVLAEGAVQDGECHVGAEQPA